MSDFLDYYKKEEQMRSMSEEERLAMHKKQKQIKAARHQYDDDDFYNESVEEQDDDLDVGEYEEYDEDGRINEGFRPAYNPNRMPTRPAQPRRPVQPPPAPQPMPQPPQRPQPRTVPVPEPEELEEFDDIMPTPVRSTRKKRINVNENFNDNPAMVKAYTMMNEMQEKIESAFYRYGMSGLEKINKHLEKIFEAIINPRPKEVVKYVEKEVIKPMPRPISRPVPQIQETIVPEQEEPAENMSVFDNINETDDNTELNEQFIKMNESFNAEDLGGALLMQKNKQNQTENTRMKQIEARAKLMQESMDKKIQKQAEAIEEQEIKEYVQPEEFEIVDDPVVEPPVQIVKDPEPEEPAKPVKSTKPAKRQKTKTKQTKKVNEKEQA